MTPQNAENGSETTRKAVHLDRLPKKVLYDALVRLLGASRRVLDGTDRNGVDLHKYIGALRTEHDETYDLLYPLPHTPEDPADAILAPASRVRRGDRVLIDQGAASPEHQHWYEVIDWSPTPERTSVVWVLAKTDQHRRYRETLNFSVAGIYLVTVIPGPHHAYPAPELAGAGQ